MATYTCSSEGMEGCKVLCSASKEGQVRPLTHDLSHLQGPKLWVETPITQNTAKTDTLKQLKFTDLGQIQNFSVKSVEKKT